MANQPAEDVAVDKSADAQTADVAALAEAQAADELARLAAAIAAHDKSYHRDDAPTVSDAEYDALRRRNEAIEARFPALVRTDSPAKTVGGPLAEGFSKVRHEARMLSLGNVFADEEVGEFDTRIRRFLGLQADALLAFTAEPKIDGLSLSLRYEAGKLTVAATRGDGQFGENVTRNALVIEDIPQTLTNAPDVLEVRGEVYMSHADFAALNERNAAAGEKTFANPRNAAAGSLRQLDTTLSLPAVPLRFFAYSWGVLSEPLGETQAEAVAQLKALGFQTNALMARCESVDALIAHYRLIEQQRASLGYDIDGVVYKVDRLDYQGRLGFVSRATALGHGA